MVKPNGTFVIDPEGKIRIVEITAGGIGRPKKLGKQDA
jgi:alkyl hydroperoxide reductase subunit AhpC